MEFLRKKFAASPEAARFIPFLVFLVLTSAQDMLGAEYRYWLYLAKTLVGAWLIWEMRPFVSEMRWAFSWEAVLVGIGVCVMWIGLDPIVPKNHLFFKPGGGDWNPHEQFGAGTGMAWMFVVVRIVGSSIVVPPLEETFYRSFLYRYFVRTDFQNLPLSHRHVVSWVGTSLLFGLVHYEWLAGILCGLAYQWLVLRKGRLGEAMTAHAITNFLLGIWVVWKGAWGFW
jgi:CAAX prenyl protease-like protein